MRRLAVLFMGLGLAGSACGQAPKLGFSDGRAFDLIATDGGLLERPG
jgi:hypothetical protein